MMMMIIVLLRAKGENRCIFLSKHLSCKKHFEEEERGEETQIVVKSTNLKLSAAMNIILLALEGSAAFLLLPLPSSPLHHFTSKAFLHYPSQVGAARGQAFQNAPCVPYHTSHPLFQVLITVGPAARG